MFKYATAILLTISSMLVALPASALTINGVSYWLMSSSTGLCPDGNKKFIYGGKPYCRTYKAKISWSIPLTRVNGKPIAISELKGYQVYWTRSSDTVSGIRNVTSATTQAMSLEVFKPDQYYFAISAIDTTGLKSPLSKMVTANLVK